MKSVLLFPYSGYFSCKGLFTHFYCFFKVVTSVVKGFSRIFIVLFYFLSGYSNCKELFTHFYCFFIVVISIVKRFSRIFTVSLQWLF